MKHPYTGFSFSSIGISRNDRIGLYLISLFTFAGIAYMFFFPIFLNGNNISSQTSTLPTKHLSAASLNSEKTADNSTTYTIEATKF